jgi:hypothetical protein
MQQPKLIWFAIAFSTVIYAVMAYTIASQPPQSFDESVRNPIVMVVYGLAVLSFVAGLAIPALLRRAPAQTRMIVTLAVFESCAVFGLIGAFISRDWRVYLPAWALAVIGFMRAWPSGEVTAVPGSSQRPL